MKKGTLVYYNGGDTCLQIQYTSLRTIKLIAPHHNQQGYLIGYRYWNNEKQRVIVFFKERPDNQEIMRRRSNGFLAARWFDLK